MRFMDYIALISRGKRFVRLCIFIFFVFLFILTFALLAGLTIFDRQHNNIIHDYVARNDDIVVLSTTFYDSTAKTFPPNTAVILFNAVQVFHLKHRHLTVAVETIDGTQNVEFRVKPVIQILPFFCKWVPFLAVAQVPADHVALKLSTNDGVDGMELALRKPYGRDATLSKNVVACFSPMFLNERWQLLLTTRLIYSHYGAFLHFYVRSMITDLFNLIKNDKNVRITAWPSLQLGAHRATSAKFDPNLELEFRNQASAMTDCLLLYKEAARFIVFPDPDDLIIPSSGRSYEMEFEKAFQMFPTAAVIAYNMSQAMIESTTSPSRFSPLSLISSLKFKGEQRWGKLVVRPDRVDSVWIHRSFGIKPNFEQKTMPIDINSVLHLRSWNFIDNWTTLRKNDVPVYNPKNLTLTTKMQQSHRSLFSFDDGLRIERKFRNWLKNPEISQIYSRLPSVSLYYPLIEACYNRIFYDVTNVGTCKGPEYCNIPQFPGLRCVNVAREFVTYKSYKNLFIHQLISNDFEESENGCTL